MSSRPLDTSPAVWSTYRAVLARMDGPARVPVAVARNPDLDEREVLTRLIAEGYGVDLAPDS